jgi:SAM-dependent methyltransferase
MCLTFSSAPNADEPRALVLASPRNGGTAKQPGGLRRVAARGNPSAISLREKVAEMPQKNYFMESDAETLRLEVKTDPLPVLQQARWAGLHPGMRVADVGCGPGKTTATLFEAAGPGGEAVGIDIFEERLAYARDNYARPGLSFVCGNALQELGDLGGFDFVWCRFLFEYYREQAEALFCGVDRLVRPGGILCLVDLDHNCMNYDGLPKRLEQTVREILRGLEEVTGFDPFAGRRLYGRLYDHGYTEIDVQVGAHNLLFGQVEALVMQNWRQKLCMAIRKAAPPLTLYPGGEAEFLADFEEHFSHPRRFSYAPIIACRGRKPAA